MMTYDELKAEAKRQGYNLIKKQPYITLLKHCGMRPHEWFHSGPTVQGYYYECPVCGLRCDDEYETERLAKTAWNELVRGEENVTDKP